MARTGSKKVGQSPLGECPAELVTEHMVGTCWSCWRPMVAKRTTAELYEGYLDAWFVRKGCNGQCGTCYQKHRQRREPRAVRVRRRQRQTGPLTPEKLLELRLAVGACGECGWADDDNAEPHAARHCRTYESQRLQARIDEGITRCIAS